jgi:hypothetical protein
MADEERSPVDRLVERSRIDETGVGKPLSQRAQQSQRSLEAYLKAGNRPRWMARLSEIEQGIARAEREIGAAYRELRDRLAADPERFARRWRELAPAQARRFEELNELIAQHNEWYPIERQLPMNPRTGAYVPVGGRPYERRPVDVGWILERFPAEAEAA